MKTKQSILSGIYLFRKSGITTLLFVTLITLLLLPACVKRSAKCRADAKKAKKNNIGWKY